MFEPVPAAVAVPALPLDLLDDPDAFLAVVTAAGPGPWAASALSLVDPAWLSESGRLELLRAWQAQAAWTEAQGAAVLASHVGLRRHQPTTHDDASVVDQRSRLCEAGLVLRMSETAVRDRWDVARDLATRLPRTARALAEGTITWQHARAVSESTATLDDDRARLVEERVLDSAAIRTPARLRARCRAQADRVDAEAARRRLQRAHRDRRLERFGDGAGSACLQVWSTPRDIQALWASLTVLAGPDEADDPRSLGARRVDALLGLCLGAVRPADGLGDPTPAPRRNPPVEVQVVVDLATLVGLSDSPGQLRGHGPIPPGVVREWLADATVWRRLVTDPVTGHLLDYGPRVRFAPRALKAFVAARDQRCIFPGCRQPADRCDADHDPPWRPDGSGGSTSADSLAPLCRPHHRWRTHHGWTFTRLAAGRYRWTSPSGRSYLVSRPRVLDDTG